MTSVLLDTESNRSKEGMNKALAYAFKKCDEKFRSKGKGV